MSNIVHAARVRRHLTVLLAIVVSAINLRLAEAHPAHASLAEADWNHKTRCLEVALKASPSDLQTAVQRFSGKPIELEGEDAESYVRKYVQATLVIRESDEIKSTLSMRWVGMEVGVASAWLYFEIPLPRGPDGIVLENSFLSVIHHQLNTWHIRTDSAECSLLFSTEQRAAQVFLRPKSAAERSNQPE